MGGKLVVASIDSNNQKKAFKIHTSRLNLFNSLDVLNEDYFFSLVQSENLNQPSAKSFEEHDDYEIDHALFAPYYYGIVLIDFKNKNFYNANDYNSLINTGENLIIDDYKALGIKKQTQIPFSKNGKISQNFSIYSPSYAVTNFIKSTRLIESCIRLNGTMLVNNEYFEILPTDDFFSLASRIYGMDIFEKSEEDIRQFDIQRNQSNKSKDFDLSKYHNVDFTLPGWTIFNNNASYNYIKEIYEILSTKNVFSEIENLAWLKFLEEKSN